MSERPVYLWTLPMFHCNGWCFPWTLALLAGTHVCLRWVRAKDMYAAIARAQVTHLCGAPIVMAALLNAKPEERRPFSHTVNFVHAAAPPPEAILMAMLKAGFELTHVYGLTETYGPATVNEWQDRMGRASDRRDGRQTHPPGRAVSCAGGADRARSRTPWSRCPPTARRWARSCSAATS